ncbi:MAG: hypothetical protein WKG32_11415 [Gemmatimonadaceae bacterium]
MNALVARAPTRIDFGGGWTDVPPYSNEQGGCVCNVAIARYATVELRAQPGAVTLDEDGATYEAATPDDLPRGGSTALAGAALRRAGVRGVRLALRSDFPAGAGLGGSSAAGVALAGALAAWRGDAPSAAALAERSREVEVEELGIAGGRQDHYAAALGGALGLWFGGEVRVRRIALRPAFAAELASRCVVAYTGRSRISGETITAVVDAYRAREPRVTSALGRIRELAESMVGALERGSLDELGALVAEHWEQQRALHAKISTPEIERVLDAARRAGALGGKALGASGGGCVVVIAPAGGEVAVREAVAGVSEIVPYAVDEVGVRVVVPVRDVAGDGAEVER